MKPGDKVYHRGLELHGTVADPADRFLGIDPGWSALVDFEDGETREVSLMQLVLVEEV